MTTGPHLGWRKPRTLPHYDAPAVVQHVIFRLADAIAPGERARIASLTAFERFGAAEALLDRNGGSRLLADPRAAEAVARTLRFADGERYDLLAWCVMPSHVHVLFAEVEGWPMHRELQAWKTISAREINRALGRSGAVWSRDYFDRLSRSARQRIAAAAYIETNPVKAGLCAEPGDWRWSSAFDPGAKMRSQARWLSRFARCGEGGLATPAGSRADPV